MSHKNPSFREEKQLRNIEGVGSMQSAETYSMRHPIREKPGAESWRVDGCAQVFEVRTFPGMDGQCPADSGNRGQSEVLGGGVAAGQQDCRDGPERMGGWCEYQLCVRNTLSYMSYLPP